MNHRPILLAGTLALLAAACAKNPENPGTISVKTNAGVASSMAEHKTYAFQAVAPAPRGDAQWDQAPDAIAVVKERVDAELQAKGYVLSEHPEMTVRISIGVRQMEKAPTGKTAATGIDVPPVEETDLDLDLDVFDYANPESELFHGHARDELHHREVEKDKLAKAVRLILEPVPAARP